MLTWQLPGEEYEVIVLTVLHGQEEYGGGMTSAAIARYLWRAEHGESNRSFVLQPVLTNLLKQGLIKAVEVETGITKGTPAYSLSPQGLAMYPFLKEAVEEKTEGTFAPLRRARLLEDIWAIDKTAKMSKKFLSKQSLKTRNDTEIWLEEVYPRKRK